jgi:hypothetical protein
MVARKKRYSLLLQEQITVKKDLLQVAIKKLNLAKNQILI